VDVEALPTAADELGEGPVWEPETGLLWWVDITGRAVRRRDLARGDERRWPTPSNVGCLALTTRGDLLIALADGVHRLDPEGGAIVRQSADPEPDLPTVFNDGWVDPGGRFWCGTADEVEQRPRGSLYRFDPDGSWTRQVRGVVESNGLDWSPDGRTLYFTDSGACTITAYDYDAASGAIERPRLFARDEDCCPDGLTVDAEGGVWSVKWDGWRLVRYDPDGGVDRVVEVPVQRPTAVAFGGPELRTAYVTSARFELDDGVLAGQPLAGRVLVLDLGVAGRPPTPFAG
jgi:sugar lactone lactonase YvrE